MNQSSRGYSYTKLAQLFFTLFVLSVGLHKSNYLIKQLTDVDIQGTLQFTLLAFPLLFLAMSYWFIKRTSQEKYLQNDNLVVKLILIYVNILLVYGVIRGNLSEVIFQEYWTGLVVLFAYKISQYQSIWDLFRNKLWRIFILFTIAVLVATQYTQEHLETQGVDALSFGVTTASLGYELAPILDFWPFLFALAYFDKKRKRRFLIYLPFIVYLLLQLYFLKRAPSVRAIAILMAALYFNLQREATASALVKYFIYICLIGILIYLVIPEALIARFQTEDTARQDESMGMISQLSYLEYLIGRGLGGEYLVSEGGIVHFIDDQGREVNTTLHIGAAYPILKGGFILLALLLFHIISTIRRGIKRIKSLSNEAMTGLVFLTTYCLFRLIEGPFTPGTIFDATLFGMSLGVVNRGSKIHSKKLSRR